MLALFFPLQLKYKIDLSKVVNFFLFSSGAMSQFEYFKFFLFLGDCSVILLKSPKQQEQQCKSCCCCCCFYHRPLYLIKSNDDSANSQWISACIWNNICLVFYKYYLDPTCPHVLHGTAIWQWYNSHIFLHVKSFKVNPACSNAIYVYFCLISAWWRMNILTPLANTKKRKIKWEDQFKIILPF